MIWRNWNKADKTLLAAGAIFFFSLGLRFQYPENLLAQGMLFCAEAALVGGIADWFAVTALFEKPLGFSYHTAILPRRRAEFIAATGKMLQQEFFSRKKLVSRVRRIDFAEKLALWLRNEKNLKAMSGWASVKLLAAIENNKALFASWIENQISQMLDADKSLESLAVGLENSVWKDKIADKVFRAGLEYVSQDTFKDMLKGYLERYQEAKLDNPMARMMAGFAQSVDLINLDEAAQLAQEQMICLLKGALEKDSEDRRLILDCLDDCLKKFVKNEAFKQDFWSMWQNITDVEVGNKVIEALDTSPGGAFHRVMEVFLSIIGNSLAEGLARKDSLKHRINDMCYQLCARGALSGQEMLGEVVQEVLGGLTDQQLKHLVYDKVEPDLLWIRMNGSIVGAAIGLLIFAVSQLSAVI